MLLLGDCNDHLKDIKDNSLDLIVTDPPYGLEFMGKDWDRVVVPTETWRECYRVLKQGKLAFVMCSPRQDVLARMIVNLQDAGFRTNYSSIYWTYACLSEDTEVLTRDGWERFYNSNNFKSKEILCYDLTNDKYHFETPQEWKIYPKVKDTLYRIRSDNTDQLVTRNHRCIIEREGKLLFQFAEEIGQKSKVPYLESLQSLQESVFDVSNDVKRSKSWTVLFRTLQTESSDLQIPTTKQKIYSFNVGRTKADPKRTDDGREEQGLERWSHILQNSWKLCRSKIHSLSKRVLTDGKERRLCDGTQDISSQTDGQVIIENGSSPSYRPQSDKQQHQQSYVIYQQPAPQETRTLSKSYKTTLATVTREDYSGLVFCPVVSTGCFVARRNGKIFLTGNSGFPKAANVSKLIDKRFKIKDDFEEKREPYVKFAEYLKQARIKLNKSTKDVAKMFPSKTGGITGIVWNWENAEHVPTPKEYIILKEELNLDNKFDDFIHNEREHVKRWEAAQREITGKSNNKIHLENLGNAGYKQEWNLTKPATEEAKKMEGAYVGFQPKPAVEVILVVSKGKTLTWLDDCRIPYQSEDDKTAGWHKEDYGFGYREWSQRMGYDKVKKELERAEPPNEKGRFPANLLVSDDVLNDGKITKSVRSHRGSMADIRGNNYGRATEKLEGHIGGYNDEGSYSRYFSLDSWAEKTLPFLIVPKASKSERNKGCEDLPLKEGYYGDGRGNSLECFGSHPNPVKHGGPRQNIHPTVKPLKLMSYLITMGSREGDLVLDPFCGSGTVCIAADQLHRKWLGIEKNPEYAEIIKRRLSVPLSQLKLTVY